MDIKMEDTSEDRTEQEDVKEDLKNVRADLNDLSEELKSIDVRIKEAKHACRQAVSIEEKALCSSRVFELLGEKKQMMNRRDKLETSRMFLLEILKNNSSVEISRKKKKRDEWAVSEDVQGVLDHSQHWIKYMLLPDFDLPNTACDLHALLYGQRQDRKLPVTRECYALINAHQPEVAAKYLIQADGSAVAVFLSAWVWTQLSDSVTEINTTLLIAGYFMNMKDLFVKYSGQRLQLSLAFNSTERARLSYSGTVSKDARPDTIGIVSGCTLFVGEDKLESLLDAENDLRVKIMPLRNMFYGDLKFILGYVAAGTEVRWVYLGPHGGKDLDYAGPALNLKNLDERCEFLLSVLAGLQVLKKMAETIPDVPGRRPMFSVDTSPDKNRTLEFLGDTVVKKILAFETHCQTQGTNFEAISRAYKVAKGKPHLLQAEVEPVVKRQVYKVISSPVGHACVLKSELDCAWMVYCVCTALAVFHESGLVHRDIRMPNIVRLSETDFVLIDYESVAEYPCELPPKWRSFRACKAKMFVNEQYVPSSDMYMVGQLLRETLSSDSTQASKQFMERLQKKELSASQALQDPWFTFVGIRDFPVLSAP